MLVPCRSVRLVAGLATRSLEVTAADLAEANPAALQRLRAELEVHGERRRVECRQYRREHHGYLITLEKQTQPVTWW